MSVRVEGRLPNVQGRCLACKNTTLFLGEGGYVTCGWDACPNRVLADELLHFTEWPPEAIEAAADAIVAHDLVEWWGDAHRKGRDMKQTRTEFYDADNAAMRGIGMMEEVGWAVRQIVSTALGLIVVYERVSS